MAHFAEIDNQGVVNQVLVVPDDQQHRGQEFLANDLGLGGTWIQTSYNTRAGVHYGQDKKPDGGVALRKNYAGIGYTYDAGRDAFIPPSPYPSWNLNEETCLWDAPVPKPEDGKSYYWDEPSLSWIEIKKP